MNHISTEIGTTDTRKSAHSLVSHSELPGERSGESTVEYSSNIIYILLPGKTKSPSFSPD